MQFVMSQLPCVPAYSCSVPSASVTVCVNRWVQVAPAVRAPLPPPRSNRLFTSTSRPSVRLFEEFWNTTEPFRMAPMSFGDSRVAGSRVTRPASTADCGSSMTGRPLRLICQISAVMLDLG